MEINKFKALMALLTGGIPGLIKYALNVFNEQVLAKIRDLKAAEPYLKDAQSLCTFLGAILENHSADLSESRKDCIVSIMAALEELIKALQDFTVEEEELDQIIQKVNVAIDAWKKR